eukprot:TRINITY_DN4659_c0_g1_i1.p1 TRINITY_DN4659_c0_g1~~TRINITY_DN4659_c0_g1_i1.p1  ORF type:complete len:281 (-),score=27.94 TRINITY_DN4659_c0_g1_i1:180-1022(-)
MMEVCPPSTRSDRSFLPSFPLEMKREFTPYIPDPNMSRKRPFDRISPDRASSSELTRLASSSTLLRDHAASPYGRIPSEAPRCPPAPTVVDLKGRNPRDFKSPLDLADKPVFKTIAPPVPPFPFSSQTAMPSSPFLPSFTTAVSPAFFPSAGANMNGAFFPMSGGSPGPQRDSANNIAISPSGVEVALPSPPLSRKKPSRKPQKKTNRVRRERAKDVPNSLVNYCRSCGETKTSEWRRGPDGYKSLCNACGIHYAKVVKKEEEETNNYRPKSHSLNMLLN